MKLPCHRVRKLAALGLLLVACLLPASPGLAQLPAPSADPVVMDPVVSSLVAQLDQHFNRGDANGYTAAFTPDHGPAHARHEEELRQRLTLGLWRRSTPIDAPRKAGDRHWLRLRHDFFAAEPSATSAPRPGKRSAAPLLTEYSLLAVAADATGRWQPRFAVMLADGQDLPPDQLWRCTACNFEVGGVDGWLCVPEARCQAQALEAVTFYLLGSDLSCEVSVRAEECPMDSPAPTATQLAQAVAVELTQRDASARQQLVLPWQVTSLPENTAGCSAAKVRLDLDGGRQVCVAHLATFGRLQHLVLLRGSPKTFLEQAEAIARLLSSFRILDPARAPGAACAMALQHHTGGVWEGDTTTGLRYTNAAFGLSLQGPEGWVAGRRCGGALVRVVWEGPAGGRLWLHGYAVPPGLSHWCMRTANLWLQRLAAASGMELPAQLPTWRPCGVSDHLGCQLTCSQRAVVEGLPSRTRWLKVMLRPDLLVVVDAAPALRDQEPALQAALDSLQLR